MTGSDVDLPFDSSIDYAAIRAEMVRRVTENPLLIAGEVYDELLREAAKRGEKQ